MPTRQRKAWPTKAPSPRNPDVRETIPTAAKKGPNVPSTINNGATDGGTILPIPWSDATSGSQHSHEIPNALIVKMTAERLGESRGRVTGRCNGPDQTGLPYHAERDGARPPGRAPTNRGPSACRRWRPRPRLRSGGPT